MAVERLIRFQLDVLLFFIKNKKVKVNNQKMKLKFNIDPRPI